MVHVLSMKDTNIYDCEPKSRESYRPNGFVGSKLRIFTKS